MSFIPLFRVPQGIWIPEGETVKLPVAIKVILDRSEKTTFNKPTDVRKKHRTWVLFAHLCLGWIATKGLSHAAHDDARKPGPREHRQDPGHLSWRQPAAHQPAQQSGLPAGACQELQEQAKPAETA